MICHPSTKVPNINGWIEANVSAQFSSMSFYAPLCINRGSKRASQSDGTQYGAFAGGPLGNYYGDKKSKIDRGPKEKIAIFDFTTIPLHRALYSAILSL